MLMPCFAERGYASNRQEQRCGVRSGFSQSSAAATIIRGYRRRALRTFESLQMQPLEECNNEASRPAGAVQGSCTIIDAGSR